MSAVMSPANTFSHRAPWWLPGGHLQTIWPSLFSRATIGEAPRFRRERWTTPDQDFVDVDFLVDAPDADAAVCSPIDLAAGGHAIGRGFGLYTYTRMFLGTMKPKALAKLRQHPGLFDERKLRAARNLYEFDNVFTAPLHGFRDTDDYWTRASAKPKLSDIRIPALVLNALNDPFIPAESLPKQSEVGPNVTLWQPRHGGHVGFAAGALPPGNSTKMPTSVVGWLKGHNH